MAAPKAVAAGVEVFGLAPEEALRDVAPHAQAFPNGLLRNLVPCRQERVCKEDRDHRLVGAVLHLEAPRNRGAILVQPAKDFGLGRLAAGLQIFRCGAVLGALIFADAKVKMRPIEAYGQITVEFADTARLAGTSQFIGSAFDDWPENNLVPVIRENVSQKLFKVSFIERQRPRLESALAAVELRDDRVFFDSDRCIHGFLPNTHTRRCFVSKDLILSVLGQIVHWPNAGSQSRRRLNKTWRERWSVHSYALQNAALIQRASQQRAFSKYLHADRIRETPSSR